MNKLANELKICQREKSSPFVVFSCSKNLVPYFPGKKELKRSLTTSLQFFSA